MRPRATPPTEADLAKNARRREQYRAAHPKKDLICEDCGQPRKPGYRLCRKCRYRRDYAKDPERERARQRERSARFRRESPEKARIGDRRTRHGRDFEAYWIQAWDEQGGNCYLCGDPLVAGAIHVDHDHACCPEGKSCPACRRGLACARCNKVIGMASDDPVLLQRITDNLKAADERVKAQIVGSAVQLELAV